MTRSKDLDACLLEYWRQDLLEDFEQVNKKADFSQGSLFLMYQTIQDLDSRSIETKD